MWVSYNGHPDVVPTTVFADHSSCTLETWALWTMFSHQFAVLVLAFLTSSPRPFAISACFRNQSQGGLMWFIIRAS